MVCDYECYLNRYYNYSFCFKNWTIELSECGIVLENQNIVQGAAKCGMSSMVGTGTSAVSSIAKQSMGSPDAEAHDIGINSSGAATMICPVAPNGNPSIDDYLPTPQVAAATSRPVSPYEVEASYTQPTEGHVAEAGRSYRDKKVGPIVKSVIIPKRPRKVRFDDNVTTFMYNVDMPRRSKRSTEARFKPY